MSPTSTKDQMFQLVMVMTSDKGTAFSSDPDSVLSYQVVAGSLRFDC